MTNEAWIEAELQSLREQGLERRLQTYPEAGGKIKIDGRQFLNFSSNDYLGLARSPAVLAAARATMRRWGAGATASRLVVGTLPCHTELEQRLAAHKGYPCAVLFSTGHAANVGAIPAVVGRDDVVIADKLAHASIVDAAILSRADLRRFQHNDAGHLETLLRARSSSGRCLVVTESVFSMDGDLAPLAAIADVARRHGAMLMVDEAHAIGVFGPNGAGLIAALDLRQSVNLAMGTLSKALGGSGGYIACSEPMRDLLVNRARSLIYSTAPPPAVVGAALGALAQIETDPNLGARLLANAEQFRTRLQSAGLNTGASASQIVPLLVGDNRPTLALSARLREQGVLAIAIRPPTVPPGTARIRFSITLEHTAADLERAAETVIACARAEGLP